MKSTTPATNHTITFANVQTDYATPTLSVADGTTYENALADVADPTKAKGTSDKLDWAFVGWYTDKDLTTKVDKKATVTGNVTLYAKFVQVRKLGDVNGDNKVDGNDALAIKVYVKRSNAHPGYPNIGKDISNTYLSNTKYTGAYKLGDVNGDGKVDGNDALAIKVYVKRSNVHPGYPNIGKDITVVKD